MWAAKSESILLWQELPYHNITTVFVSYSGFQQMGFLFMNGSYWDQGCQGEEHNTGSTPIDCALGTVTLAGTV